MKRVSLLLLVGLSVICVAPSARATFLPYGPQNDVSLNTVINDWGWTIVYQGHYNETVAVSTMFAGVTGQYVMLAGKASGSDTIDVLAAALKTDVFTYTPRNTPHTANGAEWYYNGGSMGFAGLGGTIYQTQADVNGGRDRLSWHTSRNGLIGDYESIPDSVEYGWRSGTNTGLNGSTDWDRLVLTCNVVPLPGALLLGAIGLGVAQWRLRKHA